MRPSNKQRSRSKSGNLGNNNSNNNRRPLGNIINRVFESAGPDGKVRGTPQQIIDKYQLLARDAQLSGDRVAEQSFLQHSEHYSRLLGEAQAEQQAQRQAYERDDERREGEPRFDGQPRRDERPQENRREDNRREDNRRDDGAGYGERQKPEHSEQRQPQVQAQPAIASGLVTIDSGDPYDNGLIETPESRAAPQPVTPEPAAELAPAAEEPVAAQPAPEQVEPAAAEPAPAAAEVVAEAAPAATEEPAAEAPVAPKRGRPRRRAPRPEPEGEAAAG